MNCFNHPIENAVATCQDCNKGLCQNCARKFEIPICSTCNNKRIENEKTTIKKELLAILFIGGAISIFFFNSTLFFKLPKFYLFYASFSIVAGWRYLNKITPHFFLFLPIIGWIIYFFVKYAISAMIGPFILPYIIYKDVKRYFELK
jgi:hypothetical protein